MSNKTTHRDNLLAAPAQVFGQVERDCANEIDRVAEQMLMPRSWVVSQILREWFENRTADSASGQQSWDESYREVLGRQTAADSQSCRPALLEVV